MNCIFCHKDSSTSKSVEHIIPESLGNKDYYLPKGYVCDECNHYFAIKIERELLDQPYFVSMRFRNEIPNKKDKLVKQKMFFPGASKSTDVTLMTTEQGLIVSFDDEDVYKSIQQGKCHKMYGFYLPEPEYPNMVMSRFLTKCAYEYFLYNMGPEKMDVCTLEMLGDENDILHELREYARYGKGEPWQYSQRRIYSEGTLFYDTQEKITHETLHEMILFVKDFKKLPDGHSEAEIYFVIAIAGIEYAICLSDPDISGYNKWVEQHDGHSPLEKDFENILSSGLSDINPNLIRKDDDRIH